MKRKNYFQRKVRKMFSSVCHRSANFVNSVVKVEEGIFKVYRSA